MPKRIRPDRPATEPVELPGPEPAAGPPPPPPVSYNDIVAQVAILERLARQPHVSTNNLTIAIEAYGNGSGTWGDVVQAHVAHAQQLAAMVTAVHHLGALLDAQPREAPA